MDRLLREGNPPAGQLASPKPQYKKPGVDEYAPVEGQHGAPFATLKDASGNVVSPATEATLEQVRALLSGVATEAKLEQVRALLDGVATEDKLEQARVLLNTLSTKDFATSSNQDALKTVVDDLKSELLLVKSELANIKANQISGDQRVQLSGNITTVRSESSVQGVSFVGKTVVKNVENLQPLRLNKSYTIQITNNFDTVSRNGVQVVFTDGTSEGLQRIELPNLPAGASLVLRLSRYLAPDNEALVQVPPLCGNDFYIRLDITSTAVGKWDVVVSEED